MNSKGIFLASFSTSVCREFHESHKITKDQHALYDCRLQRDHLRRVDDSEVELSTGRNYFAHHPSSRAQHFISLGWRDTLKRQQFLRFGPGLLIRRQKKRRNTNKAERQCTYKTCAAKCVFWTEYWPKDFFVVSARA